MVHPRIACLVTPPDRAGQVRVASLAPPGTSGSVLVTVHPGQTISPGTPICVASHGRFVIGVRQSRGEMAAPKRSQKKKRKSWVMDARPEHAKRTLIRFGLVRLYPLTAFQERYFPVPHSLRAHKISVLRNCTHKQRLSLILRAAVRELRMETTIPIEANIRLDLCKIPFTPNALCYHYQLWGLLIPTAELLD